MAETDPRDARIGELERRLEAALVLLAKADARIAELERQLGRNSGNSGQPPSADPPWLARAKKRGHGRRPGGQPGHKKRERALLPAEQVDKVVELRSPACRRCARPLRGADAAPARHQVTELPVVRGHVTEYRLHTLACGCGTTTRATLPTGVPRGAFGPRLMAFVAMLTAKYQLSKRDVPALMRDAFAIEMSLGAVSGCEARLTRGLERPADEVYAHIRAAPVVNADETGWREQNRRAWLWTATTPQATAFRIADKRGASVARELLGEHFAGQVGSDRWSGYDWLPLDQRQLCWAHLRRDFQEFAESSDLIAAGLGAALLAQQRTLFALHHRFAENRCSRRAFTQQLARCKRHVRRLLELGARCALARVRGSCRHILKRWPALWTFADGAGAATPTAHPIAPTNNAAERALRPAVLWRKSSFGTASARGSRFVERAMTVAVTLKQRGKNLLAFLAQAAAAVIARSQAPSLLLNP